MGNKADDEVGKRLGVTGLLGMSRRIGMADAFHCINGCAMRAFGRQDADEASDSSDTEEDSGGSLMEWIRMQSVLRGLLSRGHGNTHLARAYKLCGIVGRPTIMTASNTRIIVYCSDVLRPSWPRRRDLRTPRSDRHRSCKLVGCWPVAPRF